MKKMQGHISNSSLVKQQQFTTEYLKDQNPTQAAIRAGYARKGAAASGRRLLQNEKVQQEIRRLMTEQQARKKQPPYPRLEKQEILDFLTLVLRGGSGQEKVSLAKENTTVSPEILTCQMRAAELLGQYYRMFEGASGVESSKVYIAPLENQPDIRKLAACFPYRHEQES